MPSGNSAISQRFGPYVRRLPAVLRPSCQITLSGRPEQRGLSKCVGLSPFRHACPVYTSSAGGSGLVRLPLSVFVFLSRFGSVAEDPAFCPSRLAAFAPLTSQRVVALVLDSLKMTRRLVKMCD